MAVSLVEFVEQLVSSHLATEAELRAVRDGLPDAKRSDTQEFARELVRQKMLTAYQATAVYQGKAQSLFLGSYVLLDKLGQGGMGLVFKAEHRHMKRVVALKVLPPSSTKSPDVIKRFHREVEAAARLAHPNIVTAFDAGEANKVHFLVMEFVDGSDLSQVVKKQGPMPHDKAVQCILQAGRGLEAAHAAGVVHRDIKPANLLLDKLGVVKILDMGLARLDEGVGGSGAGMTQTGAIMGTVDYMPPEQALNSKNADARADIYSLGCSLFYLLTGRPPYQGDSLMEKLLAHREHPIPQLRPLCDGLPEPLDAVFQKMVAKNPADRYQTMGAALKDLEASIVAGASTSGLGLQRFAAAPEQDSALASFLQAHSMPEVATSGSGSSPSVPSTSRGLSSASVVSSRRRKGAGLNLKAVLAERRPQVLAGCGAGLLLLCLLGWRLVRTPPVAASRPVAKADSGESVRKRNSASGNRSDESESQDLTSADETASSTDESASSATETGGNATAGIVRLFNGQDLTGWIATGKNGWSVKDGVLVADGSGVGWLGTAREYSDFFLEFEYRLPAGGNSGIFLRAGGKGPVNGSSFVEIQLLDDNHPRYIALPADRKTGGLFGIAPTPDQAGRRPVAPVDQWNLVAIEMSGRRLKVVVNGEQTLNVNLDDFAASMATIRGLIEDSGQIGLQMLGTPVEYRNIQVRLLEPGATVRELIENPRRTPRPGRTKATSVRPANPRQATDGNATPGRGGKGNEATSFRPKDWEGLPDLWTVSPSKIVGTTGKTQLPFNTFLCSRKKYRNFELSCEVQLKQGNSGIQFRSDYVEAARFILKGPQADIGAEFWGSLYGEKTGGMMQQAPKNVVGPILRPNEFNELYVRCIGKHVTIKLNGQTTVDADFADIPDEGFIGWQLHSGLTEVVFQKIVLQELN